MAQNEVITLTGTGLFSASLFKSPVRPILGPSWAHLGPFLGPSWAHLGPILASWAHLGPILGLFGAPSPILGPSWAHLGLLPGSLSPLGPILGPCSPHVGCLRPSWGHLASNLGKQWGSLRPSCDQGGCIPLVIDAFAHLPN